MAQLGEFFKGTPGSLQQIPRFTPQQQAAQNQALQLAQQGLSNNNFDFGPIAEQRRKSFLEKTVPMISERFAGQGGIGSSGYHNALLGAGSDLESNLAALQSQYGLQQQSQLHNLLNLGLSPSYDTINYERSPGFLESGAAPFFQGLGQFAAPAIGSAIGSGASSLASLLGGAGAGAATGLGLSTLGPVGAGVGAGLGLYALINYLRNRKSQQQPQGAQQGAPQTIPQMQYAQGVQ